MNPSGGAGAADPADEGDEAWVLELQIGPGGDYRLDAYHDSLRTFHFEHDSTEFGRTSASIGRRVHEHLLLGVNYMDLDDVRYRRKNGGLTQNFEWDSQGVGGFLQGDVSLGSERMRILFAPAGVGMNFGTTRFDEIVVSPPFPDGPFDPINEDTRVAEESFTGVYYALSAGLCIMPMRNVGFVVEGRYGWAGGLEDEYGVEHDLGGPAVLLGLRLRSWQ